MKLKLQRALAVGFFKKLKVTVLGGQSFFVNSYIAHEDNCFIGARSEIVEGVIVEEGSVISMGVFIGQSTRIYDRETGQITYGRIPAGSVVVSGNLPSLDGKYSLYCAVIVKQVDAKTRGKISLNELLRNIE